MKFKSWKISVIIGSLAVIGIGGAMAATNPSREAYKDYAAEKMSTYLKEEACSDVPEFLQGQCANLVDMGREPMKEIIDNSTERHNYVFFSIYETNLSIAEPLPSYHFQTIGIFNNLIIYETEEQ
ncbi:DUF4359 domain-containing protein [Euhalothece natronophila Z-M001]|uniref:DUF4359 domain-containing protein n=1 Tax=Euhalothece natronophila Z-M001 TaxID=522448 RepID=A0A5B8NJ46_9CHRO|nr:DUF4359 domain-containing protein [Euhalothece natronophila]QDZ39272.1 DUF4359 domain-containing protein [Euhalothece natronophila Z-M001]